MPTLTIRSSPSHGPETPTSYGRLLTTRSQSDILVPKPVKANLEFASPIKAQNIFLSAQHDYSKPLTRSSSALAFDNYPLPQTPVRSTSAHNFVNGPVGDDLSSSPERLAGIEIQNILFQRALTESSSFVTPKSPAPMFKLVPTTPTVKRNLSSMFETCKEESSTPSAEEQDEEEEVKPNLDRSTSFPSMTSSRDSTASFYNNMVADHDVDTDSDEDIYSSEDEEEEYYQEEPNFKMFGMYASDDEEQTPSSDGMYNFRSMTPPVRTENPLCFDDRFQHFSSYQVPEKKRYDIGVELGLFKFSPIPSQN